MEVRAVLKTVGTLNFLRNMVEEEDRVFYISPAIWALKTKRGPLRDRNQFGSAVQFLPAFRKLVFA